MFANVYHNTINKGDSQTSLFPNFFRKEASVHRLCSGKIKEVCYAKLKKRIILFMLTKLFKLVPSSF